MKSRRHARVSQGLVLGLALAAGMVPVCAGAQTAGEAIPTHTVDALRTMSEMAAVIFRGQVVAIRRMQGVVEIDFAVEDAVRGAGSGMYTLREWAGLWAAGNEPLRMGQRYLMLLHAPGTGGLSSPVGGTDGAIPILMTPEGGGALDLRWVAARGGVAASSGASYATVAGLLRSWGKTDAAR